MRSTVRFVSLIPEATEILRALGLGAETLPWVPSEGAGVPWDAQTRLIFTSETGANGGVPRGVVRRAVAGLRPRPAVYALEPASLGEILSDVKTVGDAVGRQAAARSLIEALRARIDAASLRSARAVAERGPRRVVCLNGVDPPVAVGGWLAELIGLAGGLDALDGGGRPPRVVTWEAIQAARPDLVVRVDRATPVPISDTELGEAGRRLPLATSTAGGAAAEGGRAAPSVADDSWQRGPGRQVFPGPGAVDLLERLLALILPDSAGLAGCN